MSSTSSVTAMLLQLDTGDTVLGEVCTDSTKLDDRSYALHAVVLVNRQQQPTGEATVIFTPIRGFRSVIKFNCAHVVMYGEASKELAAEYAQYRAVSATYHGVPQ